MTTLDDIAVLGGPQLPQRRHLITEVPGPRSRELAARRATALPAGLGSSQPFYVAAAGGGVLVDVDGNSFIDLASGIAVTSVGNSAPRVVEQATAQLQAFTHTCFLVNPYEGYVAVAEQLNRLTPGDHPKRTALFNTGAEAVENAVKYARVATGRPGVVVFDRAYHGRSALTMAMTGKAAPYKSGFGPFPGEVYRAPLPSPFSSHGDEETAREAALDALHELVDIQVGADQIACVVVEPVQGEGGFIVPSEGFLPAVADFARQRGILFVADEVQTGLGRTGRWFASEHEGLVPDLVVSAKALAGGLPLAAVTGRADVMDSVHRGGIGGTYSGNPVACAAALAAIETIEAEGLLERAERLGELMTERLRALAAVDARIGDIRGRGAMVAAEVVVPGTHEPDAGAVAGVIAFAQQAGVVALNAGTRNNVLRFLPPLSISDELLLEGFDVLADAFAASR
ncbi:4-aminobutyrate--2-oxoglutarate transaminase [Quadrisphaera oryzae]|uniref:4-aminobutyrate--2-oxoglutarate transaminase n=1 Tax=Quadrisphaera TaxID=317661 RepID=UPI0016457264|nr:4-aminobutyrate--2-oxoglutarate transaminase [Quadrisphaera sp. RL12-1S]MBC3763725.1 4-aminobutyrate--2-oxoglutarate transaminase [Quadrisphaera sp. RL12-1S]